jgi:hypothetical protein
MNALQAGDRLLVLGDAETLSGLEALLRTDWATLSSGGPHDEPR